MSDNRNWNGTGEQLKSALSEALQSGDFKILNELVSQTVTDAINAAGKHIPPANHTKQFTDRSAFEESADQKQADLPPNIPIWQQRAMERERQRQNRLMQEWQKRQQRMQTTSAAAPVQSQPPRRSLPAIKVKKVGGVSNVLYQVFGGIGLGITGLVTFFRIFAFVSGDTTLAGWIVNFLFLAGFYGMIRLGIGQKRRLKRAQRYLQLCDYRVYGEVAKLAAGTGKSESYVVRDLQKMLELGIFPEGHLDRQKTCFMLNDIVYRQYLEAEQGRRLRESENRKTLEDKSPGQAPEPAPEVSREQESELQTMVTEGMEYIRKLRNLNDRIPGEVISSKLFCLENLLKDIFESVRTHPEQMPRMHKLMNYYLPTTLKLVESYEEFDRVSSPGPDIVKAKSEIENTLDTINAAFRELLNTLFQDAVFDATTDAQVLKSMLAREGLMKEMAFAVNENQ
ncbi:MAG: hypothetical protein HFH93_11780 [Lachnospiraceae bacterium]|nr:hypothetical protein [Lachnospiraceae bacterium]